MRSAFFGGIFYGAASEELLALRGRTVAISLFAHGAAQKGYPLPPSENFSQAVGDLHNLLLRPQDDAVGLLEDFPSAPADRRRLFLAVLTGDEIIDHPALDGPRGGRVR